MNSNLTSKARPIIIESKDEAGELETKKCSDGTVTNWCNKLGSWDWRMVVEGDWKPVAIGNKQHRRREKLDGGG